MQVNKLCTWNMHKDASLFPTRMHKKNKQEGGLVFLTVERK